MWEFPSCWQPPRSCSVRLQTGKKVGRFRPPIRVDVQVPAVHLGAAGEDPGACQGTGGRRVGRTVPGADVEEHQGGMGCLAGSFPPRASTSLSPLTCLCVTASCAQ